MKEIDDLLFLLHKLRKNIARTQLPRERLVAHALIDIAKIIELREAELSEERSDG